MINNEEQFKILFANDEIAVVESFNPSSPEFCQKYPSMITYKYAIYLLNLPDFESKNIPTAASYNYSPINKVAFQGAIEEWKKEHKNESID